MICLTQREICHEANKFNRWGPSFPKGHRIMSTWSHIFEKFVKVDIGATIIYNHRGVLCGSKYFHV